MFYVLIGKEDGYFDIGDIIEGICNKMISRYLYVFWNLNKIDLFEEVFEKWEDLKKKEKGYESLIEEMNGIIKGLFLFLRVYKI